jgi:selenocysteine-specific elongation factor
MPGAGTATGIFSAAGFTASVIIATAGHVDHGKTSLVRQLTGVETDRLAEEQRRGLSINLGYAYLSRPQGMPLGFIDVPGHQRFINTMISGISGIDMGMLVVAADDGPMPQTHEHMDVLQLLGVEQLVLVISKIDRVSAERLQEVKAKLRGILAARPWSNVDIFPVSNAVGDGVADLKSHLLECAEQTATRASTGYFRLSIDRAFTAKGAGLVVTGTASSGVVSIGESLTLLPRNIEVRIRGIRAHGEPAERAMAGQRCALNIAGKLEAATIDRGDWLTDPKAARAGNRLDVSFSLLESAPFAIKHLAPVKMYVGAKRIAGRLALIGDGQGANRLYPGASCLAQLILDGDVACVHGERFLLRDHAENVILGGGTILDPDGPRSGKSRPERITWLKALREYSPAAKLTSLIAQDQLVNMDHFRQTCNLREDEPIEPSPTDMRLFTSEGSQWAVNTRCWARADKLLAGHLEQWHRENPKLPGIKVTALKPAMSKSCESPLAMAVLTARLQNGSFVLDNGCIHQSNFQPAVSADELVHWQKLRQYLQRSGDNIPLLPEISAQTGITPPDLQKVAKNAMKNGELCGITDMRYALPEQLMRFAREVLSCESSGEPITVIALKTRFGTGRRLTIEILEYFDQVRFTRRLGDMRVILDPDLPLRLFKG